MKNEVAENLSHRMDQSERFEALLGVGGTGGELFFPLFSFLLQNRLDVFEGGRETGDRTIIFFGLSCSFDVIRVVCWRPLAAVEGEAATSIVLTKRW